MTSDYQVVTVNENQTCNECLDPIYAGDEAFMDGQTKTIFCSDECWILHYNIDGAKDHQNKVDDQESLGESLREQQVLDDVT